MVPIDVGDEQQRDMNNGRHTLVVHSRDQAHDYAFANDTFEEVCRWACMRCWCRWWGLHRWWVRGRFWGCRHYEECAASRERLEQWTDVYPCLDSTAPAHDVGNFRTSFCYLNFNFNFLETFYSLKKLCSSSLQFHCILKISDEMVLFWLTDSQNMGVVMPFWAKYVNYPPLTTNLQDLVHKAREKYKTLIQRTYIYTTILLS